MTRNLGSDILLSGMILNPNIFISLSRKAICIAFILLVSVNLSFGNALSNHCKGGPDCANCMSVAHSQMPWTVAAMESNDCSSGNKNNTCGFENGRMPEDANHIAVTVRPDLHELYGISVTKSDVNTRPNPSGKLPLQFNSPFIDMAKPIYLLNDSLLC